MVLSLLYVFLDDKNPNFLSYLVSFLLTSLSHPSTTLTKFLARFYIFFCNFWASVAILLFWPT